MTTKELDRGGWVKTMTSVERKGQAYVHARGCCACLYGAGTKAWRVLYGKVWYSMKGAVSFERL